MKIPPFGSVNHYYKQSVSNAQQTQKGQAKQDSVEISQTAKEMQTGKIDEARAQKIEELQAKIDAGEYKVDEHAVAKKFYDYWNN